MPKLKVDRLDTDYNNIVTGQVKKLPSISKSMVSGNKLPSHLRGGNFYIHKNQVQPMREKRIRNSNVNKSVNSSIQNSLLGQNKRRYGEVNTDVSLNKKLTSKYHTARKKPPQGGILKSLELPSNDYQHTNASPQLKTLEMRRREADQAI
jgi:hypothetical protein